MAGIFRMRKLHEDKDILISDQIQIGKDQSFKIKDFRGFTVFEIKKDGQLYIKNKLVKV